MSKKVRAAISLEWLQLTVISSLKLQQNAVKMHVEDSVLHWGRSLPGAWCLQMKVQ
jgi:hypothetical protein